MRLLTRTGAALHFALSKNSIEPALNGAALVVLWRAFVECLQLVSLMKSARDDSILFYQ
ncbi:hypothetical protein BN2475_490023 [Paraburkholderia ribeironis]|uniref:Uncharacterized protein n=1 Tax=Paraburkholderia ribeironis TaxID=1247936 RepID=A0A1N7SBN9_9BURK|nr:hypothetical protein BN2475_490023 [Paraburkholderia ribeironis]